MFFLQINIIINQVTGVTNRKADLLGVRFAGINQILDPWLYVLLRKALILKIVKYLHWKICKRSKIDGGGRRTFHSYENVPVDREHISLGQLDDLQIKVLCVTVDKRSGDRGQYKDNDSSDESMSSVSNLIERQRFDMGYHSTSSELRENVEKNGRKRHSKTNSDHRLSRSARDGAGRKEMLKRNHSSPAFMFGRRQNGQTPSEDMRSFKKGDSDITI